MVLLPLFFFAIPFALALALSWDPALGPFRKSALNPLLMFAAYTLLVAADFVNFAEDGGGTFARNRLTTTPGNLILLELAFCGMLIAALCGIATVFLLRARGHFATSAKASPSSGPRSDLRLPLMLLYIALLSGWVVALLGLGIDISSLADTVEVKSQTFEAPVFFVLGLLLLPALTYALAKQSFRIAVPVVVISIALLLASGSRSRILYTAVPFAFYLVRVRGIRLPRLSFAIAIVVGVALAIAAINVRAAASFRSNASAHQVFGIDQFFNSNDASFAETNLALSRFRRQQIAGYFGEDFVGFVVAAIPRGIVPFKPDTASNTFTKVYDPFTFAQFHRSLTIGGVNEIEFSYPYPIALIVIYLLAAAWAVGFTRTSGSRSLHGFSWTVALYLSLYVFVRGDLQSTGQIVSIFVIYMLLVRGLQAMGRGSRAPSHRHARPGAQATSPRPVV